MNALRHCFTSLLALSLLAVGATAQEAAIDPDQTPVVKLTLHPAAESKPALKYPLLPHRTELQAGNAATFYYRAQIMFAQSPGRKAYDQEFAEKSDQWWNQPCEGQIREQIKKWLAQFPPGAKIQLREAVNREECNFDYRLRDRPGIEIIQFLLPEIQEMRSLGRHLEYEARVAISEQRFDDAAQTLRMGFRMKPMCVRGVLGLSCNS